ncbi:hypothetical protein NDU88_009024 [Pleurodeles waltl]|uniref:Uncharacterized protein n=1 Tax=Pleurodeles waltl TaxID=8319 RepID=A0AAV7RWD2_PLEWA|nr:hypothetical protein NDU88_009024 [Pleurodeles waltl]
MVVEGPVRGVAGRVGAVDQVRGPLWGSWLTATHHCWTLGGSASGCGPGIVLNGAVEHRSVLPSDSTTIRLEERVVSPDAADLPQIASSREGRPVRSLLAGGYFVDGPPVRSGIAAGGCASQQLHLDLRGLG